MAEKPEDLSLPASVVARIIKDALPEGVNVSKETRTAIGKAASVFILYSTACANNFALKAKRKTLGASDVFSALEDMEFETFIPELKECLEAYKQEQREKKEAAADRRKKAAAAQVVVASTTGPTSEAVTATPPQILTSAGPSGHFTQPAVLATISSSNIGSSTSTSLRTADEPMETESVVTPQAGSRDSGCVAAVISST